MPGCYDLTCRATLQLRAQTAFHVMAGNEIPLLQKKRRVQGLFQRVDNALYRAPAGHEAVPC